MPEIRRLPRRLWAFPSAGLDECRQFRVGHQARSSIVRGIPGDSAGNTAGRRRHELPQRKQGRESACSH
jgi:hypothetical protein